MKVKCLKGTTKLVKGMIYEVSSLSNVATSTYKSIRIEGFGRYTPKNFSLPDGSPLPTSNYQKTQPIQKSLVVEKIKIGDILVCRSDRYTHLMKDNKYKVIDVRKKEIKTTYGNGQSYFKYSVKFEGYNRYIEPNAWSFRELAVDESRDLNLNAMLGGEELDLKVDTTTRKIDISDDRNRTLIEALAKAIVDKNRHHLDVIDWACNQSSKSLKITRADFKALLKKPLAEILKHIDK